MNIVVFVIGAIVVLVALVAGMTWLALGGWKRLGTRFEDDASSDVGISEIHVSGSSVEVEVRPGAAPGVQVHRTARYLNPSHDRPGPTHRIDGTVLHLGGDAASTFCVIEYVVVAPAGVRVSADVTTGSLDLAGVGTVNVKTKSGSVRIADTTGDVTARTLSGSIRGIGLGSGTIVASTKSGAISLDLTAPADVEATTWSGSLGLTVPAAAYRVDAKGGRGGADIGIRDDPNGRHRLALRASTGHLTLAAR